MRAVTKIFGVYCFYIYLFGVYCGKEGKKGREREQDRESPKSATKEEKGDSQRKKKPKGEIFRVMRDNPSFLSFLSFSVIDQDCFFQILFPAP